MGAEPDFKVMIVEDDSGLQSQLRWALSEHTVLLAGDRDEALQTLRDETPAVVVLDLGLPPDANGASEGLATLETILDRAPLTKVIIASGNHDRANAVRAISLGAYDFCEKPVDVDVLKLIIDRAARVQRLERENQILQARAPNGHFERIITADPSVQRVCRTIEKVAPTDVSVLITGESGTGKELLAKALHDSSARGGQPFIAINCAAIPENLLESELFGFEKGAFTGAAKQTVGKFELAHQGTLFLDEIGDLPLALQAKLLRFLQDRVIERIGGRRQIVVDVRIVCATHQDLAAMIADGRFREDLYYRLNEISVHVPPLRERQGDGILLAKYFLDAYNVQYKKSLRGFSEGALSVISSYDWPGNVRQLENLLKKAVIMAEGKAITVGDLDIDESDAETTLPTLREVRERAERALLRQVLAATDGNVSRTAKILGVSRPTLYDLMRNHNLRQDDK